MATSLDISSEAPWKGHLDLSKKVFGYLKKYSKYGYSINPQALNIYMEYDKLELNIYYGKQYLYFQEENYVMFS